MRREAIAVYQTMRETEGRGHGCRPQLPRGDHPAALSAASRSAAPSRWRNTAPGSRTSCARGSPARRSTRAAASLTEAAIFADRIAVDEETVRLRSHLAQLDSLLAGGGAIGRKLDFLLQEMNREANTIGSKGNDLEQARTVVEIKAELEKIREQIQNIGVSAMRLINIGFGNLVSSERLLTIVGPDSAPDQANDPGGARPRHAH